VVGIGIAIAGAVELTVGAIGGIIASIIGRKILLIISAVITLISILVYFPLINTLSVAGIFVALSFEQAAVGLGYGGSIGAFLNEQFETKYRSSGAGITYMLGLLISGVVAGIILPVIVVGTRSLISAWQYVQALALIMVTFSIVCLYFTKETKRISLE